jgi:antitoxin (DNA-binding transcriptional repressor) of toxin-antitoxin stability system
MATIHIPESEAIADFGALLDRVRHGEEVVILNGAKSVAVLRAAAPLHLRVDRDG